MNDCYVKIDGNCIICLNYSCYKNKTFVTKNSVKMKPSSPKLISYLYFCYKKIYIEIRETS